MVKKVTIKINKGVISTDFEGFHGKSCEVLGQTIQIEGVEIQEKELKPEYYFNSNNVNDMEKNQW